MACNPFSSDTARFRRLSIFGAGGFGREVAWLAEQVGWSEEAVRFLVDRPGAAAELNGQPVVLLQDADATADDAYVVAIGDPAARERCSALCEEAGLTAVRLVHPRVESSRHVEIGAGSVVCAGTILTTNIRLGRHVHVNLDCTIGHDAVLSDFVTLSPGVHVSGNVHIGARAFIGTGAVIINGRPGQPLTIGEDAVVAAGSCVTKPVEPGAMVAGVPAVRKR